MFQLFRGGDGNTLRRSPTSIPYSLGVFPATRGWDNLPGMVQRKARHPFKGAGG
jgi:hypothetical protein